MTRKFFTGVIILSLFGSCHKSQVYQPAAETAASVTFKDEHIFIAEVKMQQTAASEVLFTFSTRYEKGITKVEVFGGSTKKNLCSFFERGITADSHEIKNYKAVDAIAGNDVNYYMIRYTTKSGDWSYSQLYQIKMK